MARSAASVSTDVSLMTGTHCGSLGAQHCRHIAHTQHRSKYTQGNVVEASTRLLDISVLLYACPVAFH